MPKGSQVRRERMQLGYCAEAAGARSGHYAARFEREDPHPPRLSSPVHLAVFPTPLRRDMEAYRDVMQQTRNARGTYACGGVSLDKRVLQG